jgi:serine/threonine protein kinase
MSIPPERQGPTIGKNARLLAVVQQALAGRFRVDGELGHGGMAVVFRAHNINLDRPVAIKVMRPEKGYDEGVVDRFRTESLAVANLRHPNIIVVHDRGEADEILWFEMDLVDGGSLDRAIGTGPLDPRRAARLLAGAADALAYAHARGIIHRDIKPSNLLLGSKSDHLLVTDFGIAKILGTSTLTDAGMTIGTVAYMSPEQLAVGKDLTPATDQYSLGVVAYEMIAGVRPFSADTPGQFAVMQATQPLPSLRVKAPHCPPELATLIHRMLAIRPADRWPDLSIVKRTAEEIAITGSSTSLKAAARSSAVRRLPPVLAAAAVLVASMVWIRPKLANAPVRVPNPPPVATNPPPSSAALPPVSDSTSAIGSLVSKVQKPPTPVGRQTSLRRDSNPAAQSPGPSLPRDAPAVGRSDTAAATHVTPPAIATLLMSTSLRGTFVYINGVRPPISLGTGFFPWNGPPGVIKLRIVPSPNRTDCHEDTVVIALQAGDTVKRLLNPVCAN